MLRQTEFFFFRWIHHRAMGLAFIALLSWLAIVASLGATPDRNAFFQVEVIDEQTERGVPLVEIETVNHLHLFTDSAGRVAFYEPGLMGRKIFFHVRSHGYEMPNDGFGFSGVRLDTIPGGKAVIKLKRVNLAERLYRITGEGIYRDTVMLGERAPIREPLLNAQVTGQDSAQTIFYRDKVFWFWGDTDQIKYPLGNFRTTGATSLLPERGGLRPSDGVDLTYFTDANGFTKQMCPIEPKGDLVWVDGVLTLPDESGHERLVAHYSRMKSLGEMLEHGLIVFDDEKSEFKRLVRFDREERWRCPRGHPLRKRENDGDYFYFGDAFPNVRVKAKWEALLQQSQYEAFTCLADGHRAKVAEAKVERGTDGQPLYRWNTNVAPMTVKEEARLVAAGVINQKEARFLPLDIDSGNAVKLHGGSVSWNAFRNRWVLIAVEQGGTSMLGEVWYSESNEPTGPWRRAKKIVTHNKYSFYNPVQHDFFAEQNGRIIYFEGTYVTTFSGNDNPTPRYDYNQIMYRLDLADSRLAKISN